MSFSSCSHLHIFSSSHVVLASSHLHIYAILSEWGLVITICSEIAFFSVRCNPSHEIKQKPKLKLHWRNEIWSSKFEIKLWFSDATSKTLNIPPIVQLVVWLQIFVMCRLAYRSVHLYFFNRCNESAKAPSSPDTEGSNPVFSKKVNVRH